MRNGVTALLATLLTAAVLQPQNRAFAGEEQTIPEEARKSLEKYCRENLCREPKVTRIIRKDGSVFEDKKAPVALPIVLPNGVVTIMQGEEVRVAFDVDGDKLSNPRAVPLTGNASNALTFKLSQDEKGNTILRIRSDLPSMVKFQLGMMLLNSDQIRSTSSCPVAADSSSYEHWPEPIYQILVAEIRVLPKEAPMVCK